MNKKIHLGITPSDDIGGKFVQSIRQKENGTFDVSIQKGNKTNVVNISFEHAQRIGFINLQPLEEYFKNL